MSTKQQKIMQAADLITGHAPRLSDEERLFCKRNEITPAILRGEDHRVLIFADGEHSKSIDLFRSIETKFPDSGIKAVIFTSSDKDL